MRLDRHVIPLDKEGHWAGFHQVGRHFKYDETVDNPELREMVERITAFPDTTLTSIANRTGVPYQELLSAVKRYAPDFLKTLKERRRAQQLRTSKWGAVQAAVREHGKAVFPLPSNTETRERRQRFRAELSLSLTGSKLTMPWRCSISIKGKTVTVVRHEQRYPDYLTGETMLTFAGVVVDD